MHIVIITGPFFSLPPAPCGAVEQIWCGLGQQFVARGHQVAFVARGYGDLPAEETIGGCRVIRRTEMNRTGRIGVDLAKDLAYSLRILPVVPSGDILVTNVFWLPPLLSYLRPRAGKVVINVARMPKRQIGFYRRADRLAAVSGAVRESILQQDPGAAERVRVIPNPIHTDVFRPPEFRPSGQERLILYTGRIHPEKGIHVLIDAFRQIDPARHCLRLAIVGPQTVEQGGGGDSYMTRLREAVGDMPVEFRPPITGRSELAAALRAAHLYCYPSLAEQGESFGVAPLEAMATGLAPIVSSLACFRDFIDDGRNGIYFDHRDNPAGNLAAALARAVAQPEQLEAMGKRAAADAQRFSFPAVADLYLSDFGELLARGPARWPKASPST